ncbi:unnamed protein product [Dibothriocephalus latus]|uniref:EF-hand domain-containing protein n=1 Tax=Dibothriocephalus latus TaxID=60516 RepID=A0A3P7LBJ9_DIBLA|nr:unnamed protein product [Dibothriocephalus latus]
MKRVKILDPEPTILRSNDNRVAFRLPSVYTTNAKSHLKARQSMRPSSFVKAVWTNTDTHDLQAKHADAKFPSWLRNRILSWVKQAVKDSRIHFNSTELAILFQMYFHLTHLEVRALKVLEVEKFLNTTLDISHGLTLTRLARTAQLLPTGSSRGKSHSVNPFEFVLLLSVLLRGKLAERADLAFYAMDVDGDGLLRQPVEFTALLQNSFPPEYASADEDLDPELSVREAIAFLTHKAGIRRGGSVDLEAFRELAAAEPWMVESLLRCIPSDRANMAFQCIFTEKVVLPARENTRPLWIHTSQSALAGTDCEQ